MTLVMLVMEEIGLDKILGLLLHMQHLMAPQDPLLYLFSHQRTVDVVWKYLREKPWNFLSFLE